MYTNNLLILIQSHYVYKILYSVDDNYSVFLMNKSN
jgi:hypothetical protein